VNERGHKSTVCSAIVASYGRIAIPFEIRREFGIKAGDKVDFIRLGVGRWEIQLDNSPTFIEPKDEG
jgi:AbrB family looped-hinge helix DNA binding protein